MDFGDLGLRFALPDELSSRSLNLAAMPPNLADSTALPSRLTPFRIWVLVPLLPLLAFALAGALEFSEMLNGWTRTWESHQLDELPFALLTLVMTLGWIAWRQGQIASQELGRRIQTEAELEASRLQSLELSRRMTHTLECERRQIAHELHDEFGQVLNAIKLEAIAIRSYAGGGDRELLRAADSIALLADDVYGSVRQLLRRLRPVALDELGLEGALEHALDEWRKRLPEASISLHVGELPFVPDSIAIALYRSFQESLTNIVRHARASEINVKLGLSPDGLRLLLFVGDNGVGADPHRISRGLGLLGMSERLESVQGRLEIRCAPGGGFSVSASVPLPADAIREVSA